MSLLLRDFDVQRLSALPLVCGMAVAQGLRAFGCELDVLDDGLRIHGGKPLQAGAVCDSFGDHRIAMSMTVAALAAQGTAEIEQFEAVSVSWPSFWADMQALEVK